MRSVKTTTKVMCERMNDARRIRLNVSAFGFFASQMMPSYLALPSSFIILCCGHHHPPTTAIQSTTRPIMRPTPLSPDAKRLRVRHHNRVRCVHGPQLTSRSDDHHILARAHRYLGHPISERYIVLRFSHHRLTPSAYLGEQQRRIPSEDASLAGDKIAGEIGSAPWKVHDQAHGR